MNAVESKLVQLGIFSKAHLSLQTTCPNKQFVFANNLSLQTICINKQFSLQTIRLYKQFAKSPSSSY